VQLNYQVSVPFVGAILDAGLAAVLSGAIRSLFRQSQFPRTAMSCGCAPSGALRNTNARYKSKWHERKSGFSTLKLDGGNIHPTVPGLMMFHNLRLANVCCRSEAVVIQ
jgi:hypothetical protein